MHILRIFLASALIVVASGRSAAHEGDHPYIDLEKLPMVSVEIQNHTDIFLSLTITNALCAPRIILRPGKSMILQDCLRYDSEIGGPIYHVRTVFYNKTEVLETRDFLFVAKPDTPWIFCKLSPNKTQC